MTGTEPDARMVLRPAIPSPPDPAAALPTGPGPSGTPDPTAPAPSDATVLPRPGVPDGTWPDPPGGAGPAAPDSAPIDATAPGEDRAGTTAPGEGAARPGRHRYTSWPVRGLRAVLAPADRVVRRAGRATATWARAGGGRFVLPALAVVVVLAGAGGAGGYVVPAAAPARSPTPVPATTGPGSPVTAGPIPTGPTVLPPDIGPSGAGLPGGSGGRPGRPQTALAAWAANLAPAVGVPAIAMAAYGYAELVVRQTQPSCHLRWSTLAGIGKIESDHGRANGATLEPDGRSVPPIIGPALDGTGDRRLIRDTDNGTLDGDTQYDHAVGPMQFIPSTWKAYKIDADLDGTADPNDLNDAALAAANYLCAGKRDLSTPAGWWSAVLSYNALQSYAEKVFAAANDYGVRSRKVT